MKTAGILSFLVLACAISPVQAQIAAADPIEELRRVLKAPVRDLAQRDLEVKKAIDALASLDDLRRGLGLLEWRDEDADDRLAAIDHAHRATAAMRFEHGVRAYLEQGDPDSRLAILNMLA